MVDEFDEGKLELVEQALHEIRDDGFELTDDEERELLEREAECDRGEKLSAREFLADLRHEGPDSNR